MGKSQETFSKKEREKKRLKKKQDKDEKKAERKANSVGGKSLEDMMAYIDENGNISSMPPDPKKKKEIKAEDILIDGAKMPEEPEEIVRRGRVSFFNETKGYGFIKDDKTKEGIFVHINVLKAPLKENELVTFETARDEKGIHAIAVTVITE
jgi:cold shock CspA family protein